MNGCSELSGSGEVSGAPDFERLGDLLGDVCEAPGAHSAAHGRSRGADVAPGSGGAPTTTPEDPARLLALVWADVVGAEVAANARPVQLRKGRLAVSVSSTVWAQTLQFMGETIVARLTERLGPGFVEQVVFRHAGWEERPRRHQHGGPAEAQEHPAGLSADQKEALDRVEGLDLPPELRARMTRAMRAAFVRGEQDSVR